MFFVERLILDVVLVVLDVLISLYCLGRRLPPLHNHPWSIAAMRRALRQSASPVKPSVAVAERDQAIQEQTKESVENSAASVTAPNLAKEKESTPADQARWDDTAAAVKTLVVVAERSQVTQKHKESVDSVAASEETAPSLASVEPSVTKEKESTPQNQARGHETAASVKPSLTEEKKPVLQYQAKAKDRAAASVNRSLTVTEVAKAGASAVAMDHAAAGTTCQVVTASVKRSLTVETARKVAIGEQKPGKLPNLEDTLEFPSIPEKNPMRPGLICWRVRPTLMKDTWMLQSQNTLAYLPV